MEDFADGVGGIAGPRLHRKSSERACPDFADGAGGISTGARSPTTARCHVPDTIGQVVKKTRRNSR